MKNSAMYNMQVRWREVSRPGLDMRIILKWVLMKQDDIVDWIGVIECMKTWRALGNTLTDVLGTH